MRDERLIAVDSKGNKYNSSELVEGVRLHYTEKTQQFIFIVRSHRMVYDTIALKRAVTERNLLNYPAFSNDSQNHVCVGWAIFVPLLPACCKLAFRLVVFEPVLDSRDRVAIHHCHNWAFAWRTVPSLDSLDLADMRVAISVPLNRAVRERLTQFAVAFLGHL